MVQNCDICGKKLYAGIISGNVGGRCRFCGRLLCTKCTRDGLCPPCWEKNTGKRYRKY